MADPIEPQAVPRSRAASADDPAQTRADTVKGRRGGVFALAFANIVDGFEGGLINTLFPVIRDALSLQTSALGVLVAISRFARMVLGPVWASLADRYGRKRILFIATGLWGLWTVAAGFAQNATQLFVLYTIGVLGTVASEPIANGLVVDMFDSAERGRAFGILRTTMMAASLIGTPILGQLADVENGWRYGLFALGGISVVSGVVVLLFVPEVRRVLPASTPGGGTTRFNIGDAVSLLRNRTILFMAVQVSLTTSLVLFAFFVTFWVDARGWGVADAAILMAVYMLGNVLSSFLGGLLGDRFARRFGHRGRIILMQGYLIGYAVSTVLLFQVDWGTGPAVYLAVFVTGLIASIGPPGAMLLIIGSVVPPSVVATAYALIMGFVQGGVAALFSLVFGFLGDVIGLQYLMFWLVSVPYAVNAVLWSVMYRIYPGDAAAQEMRDRQPRPAVPGPTTPDRGE